ncbi:hypothetical protein [Idiomarina ramblicola]|uniref:Uncharacterized protein n=1 Tax=Idiomarina ramblicola TaxID=263724 RepID=A0A432YSK3_9GAMM|nr:hypothetical protein [Idiomarina ramblicola]RUO64675.1 hypothetical protein CWI78_12285 [Idiomarina ramblicola]
MASLNLLQWREQSLWRRYRGLHGLGVLMLLAVSFFAVQWVNSYSEYLRYMQQQVAEQNLALEERKHQQQRWFTYQRQQQARQAFMQRKHNDQRRLNAFFALLNKTQSFFQQRELSIGHSQLTLAAEYQKIDDVNDHYVWLERQLASPGIKQQLLPQQRVLFHYVGNLNETESNG